MHPGQEGLPISMKQLQHRSWPTEEEMELSMNQNSAQIGSETSPENNMIEETAHL